MKRLIFYYVLLTFLFCWQGVTFCQNSLNNFEQEKASALAQEIARQKNVTQENDLDELEVDALTFVEEARIHWANLEFNEALNKLQAALKLKPNDKKILMLFDEIRQNKLVYEKHKIETEQEALQKERILETDKAWLMQEPKAITELEKQKIAIPDALKEKASKKISSLDFSDAQLAEVIEYLSKVSAVNIIMDEAVVSHAGSITIHLKEVTLVQALESVLRTKGLGYRFEKDFIWVSTKENIEREDLVTRIYHLSQGLATFTTFTTFDTVTIEDLRGDNKVVLQKDEEANNPKSSGKGVRTYEGVKIGGSGGVEGKITMTIKDVLKEIVDWPAGSRLFLDNRTSTLIVRNTPSNLAIIEQALQVLDVNPPQVMIEARFVEIGADDLLSLGIKVSAQVSGGGAISPNTYPFNKDQQTKYVTSFPLPKDTDFTFGRLDFSQFQAVLSAIEQNKNSNTLSSPKITTISGQEAVIKIVKEYRYPTKYDIKSYDAVVAGQTRTYYAVVPSEFKARDIGIILKVTPNVGSDGKTINLTLVPEVSEFDIEKDMYNFGTQDQPFKQPFFSVRNCTASIVVNNNDTVVMGGLMRETIEHAIDRVPLLGSLPLIGNIFSRKYDNRQKRNLLIFVTARIIAPTGQKVQDNNAAL